MEDVKVLSNEYLKSVMWDTMSSRSFISDANAALNPGIYDTGDGCANLPSGISQYGTLSVCRGGYFGYQEYSTFQNPPVICRRLIDRENNFTDWSQLT